MTIKKQDTQHTIQLKLSEPNVEPKILVTRVIPNYRDEITFKIISENHKYKFYYSTPESDIILLGETQANHILSRKYTGAYLGLYASSNGQESEDFADFYWVNYKAFQRF